MWDDCETNEVADGFIFEVTNHFRSAKGKQVRTELLLDMLDRRGRAQGALPQDAFDRAKVAARAIETMHTASLIHDDLLDGAQTRREIPSMNAKYGSQIAIVAGDAQFAKALAVMASLNDGYCISQMMIALREMCDGQLRECAWKEVGVKPQRGEILDALRRKTGALFGLASRLGAYFALLEGITAESAEFLDSIASAGEKFGIAFQLRDDLADLEEDRANETPTYPALFGEEETADLIKQIEEQTGFLL